MTGFLVAHKGFIGKIVIENDSTITIHKFQVDVKTRQLDEKGNFCWSCKTKLEIVKSDLVEETRTGYLIPCVVVRLCHESDITQNQSYYILGVDLDREKITPLRKCVNHSKAPLALNDQNTHLLNGPSVIICNKSELSFYSSFESSILKQYAYKFSRSKSLPSNIFNCSRCSNNCRVKGVNLLDYFKLQRKCLLFTQFGVVGCCENHERSAKNIVQPLLFSDEKFTLIESQSFLPQEYIDCVVSLKLKNAKHVDDKYLSEAFLGTAEGYIVHVVNGKMVNCVRLVENSCIRTIETGIHCAFQGDAILVRYEGTYAVLDDKFQVQDSHLRYNSVVVGDFIKNGSEQCLMLEDSYNIEQSSWVLTDLQSICYTSNKDEKAVDSSNAQSGIEATVKALTTKCQLEQINVYEEELGFQLRNNFITETLDKQKALLSNNTPQSAVHYQTNMVPLIVNKTAAEQTSSPSCSMTEDIDLDVSGIWQRTYLGQWCVGVDIDCHTSRPLTMWIDVVLQDSSTNSTSVKSYIETTPATKQTDQKQYDSGVEKSTVGFKNTVAESVTAKYSKDRFTNSEPIVKPSIDNPKSKVSKQFKNFLDRCTSWPLMHCSRNLNCVLALPSFKLSEMLTANVILNYQFQNDTDSFSTKFDNTEESRKGENSNIEVDNIESGSKKRKEDDGKLFTKSCGTVVLSVTDVLEGKFELNYNVNDAADDIFMENLKDLQRDRQAWQCIQTRHQVEVVAPPGVLCRFESLLTTDCQFLYQERYDCYVSQNKSLDTVQIQLGPRSSDDKRSLTIYTRSDEDLFLVVHLLYRHLPDCAVILPKPVSQNAIQSKCLQALQKEADFLHSGLKELLSDTDSIQALNDLDDENDDIRKVGEKFKRGRENVLRKHKEVLENDKVQHFMEQYRKLQLKTDEVVIAMS